MNNHNYNTVWNLHRFAFGRAPEPPANVVSSTTASIRHAAKGVYDTAEIPMWRNPERPTATPDHVPGASLIRRFRRLTREAIRATLEEAFPFLRRKAKAAALVPSPGQPTTSGSSSGRSFNPQATTVLFVQKNGQRPYKRRRVRGQE